jgi:hypothetical protein
VYMISLNTLRPSMISLYSLNQMTMLVLMLEPCNILSATSCNELILSYKLV